jgi:hypothetical protein
VEPALVPLGTLGLSLFAVDLYFSSAAYNASAAAITGIRPTDFVMLTEGLRILVDLVLIGMSGGFFIVPLYTMIQQGTEDGTRARALSVNNIMNALFMVIGSLLGIVFLSLMGWTIPQFFVAIAGLNLLFMGIIFYLQPLFLSRFKDWLLAPFNR